MSKPLQQDDIRDHANQDRTFWWQQAGTNRVCKAVDKTAAAEVFGCKRSEVTKRTAENKDCEFVTHTSQQQ